MPVLELIDDNYYKGYRVNTAHGPLVKQWLDKLIDLSNHALEEQYEPVGYVLTFELCKDRTIKQFHEALTYWYHGSSERSKSPCKPIYATKFEIKELTTNSPEYPNVDNPSDPYAHYHMALMLDAKRCRDRSLSLLLARAQEKGLIAQYKISLNKYTDLLNKSLTAQFAEWIYHTSYLTKLETKANVRKPFNTVRFKQRPKHCE